MWGDASVSQWFSKVLGIPCWLARYSPLNENYELPPSLNFSSSLRQVRMRDASVAFANEQPLLLISEHAVDLLNEVLLSQNQKLVSSRQFRPNLVVRRTTTSAATEMMGPKHHATTIPGGATHLEDSWTSLQFTSDCKRDEPDNVVKTTTVTLDVVGPCARCSMVDVDPASGGCKGKTLRALAEYRRNNGQITFGIFLRASSKQTRSAPTASCTENTLSDFVWIQEGDLMTCWSEKLL